MSKGFDFDKNYVPLKPTKVITAEQGSVRVVVKLYGEVTPERASREVAAAQYRVLQLTPPERRRRSAVMDDEFEIDGALAYGKNDVGHYRVNNKRGR